MREGLRRVSAVFWGFWGLIATLLIVGGWLGILISHNNSDDLWLYVMAAASFVLHRLTCWVIDGFFAQKRAGVD